MHGNQLINENRTDAYHTIHMGEHLGFNTGETRCATRIQSFVLLTQQLVQFIKNGMPNLQKARESGKNQGFRDVPGIKDSPPWRTDPCLKKVDAEPKTVKPFMKPWQRNHL